ncbi:ABC transporter [Actinotalea ferrariae CF5-4]|uniref:ABC transporter n=1 Tax=Actinotalea ferrariae CF5-4 TaxID=948458 RepID=A0A021VLP6_9CELL|nr:DUF302 domain-containing protein [Actinotalea ferrariae]EYR62008.1 ABC transporter [Actinotalea ferrariae CF5-4]
MGYALSTVLARSFDETVDATRAALQEQGFGVLTEIDMTATLKAKIGVDVPRQVILGACNPPLAHRALQAEATIGLLLPCNVVVRDLGDGRTGVDFLDPQVMSQVTANPEVATVADDAGARLQAARERLEASGPTPG